MPKVFSDKSVVSVEEVQEWWIAFYRTSILPEFPLSFSSGESSIKLKDAMFCFLGSWLYGAPESVGSGGKVFQKTNYAVVPLASLGASVLTRLVGQGRYTTSIFQDYGFSSELILRPHSLRHLSNTLADLSSIPVEIITAWSGRKNPEQTHMLPPVHFPPTCRNFIDPVSSTKRVVEFRFQTAGLGQNSVGTWVKNALAITFDVCGSTASRSGLAQ